MKDRVNRILSVLAEGRSCPSCLCKGEPSSVVFSVAMLYGRMTVREDPGPASISLLCRSCSEEIILLASEGMAALTKESPS